MKLLAIDPGTTRSAYVLMNSPRDIAECGTLDNGDVENLIRVRDLDAHKLVIEMVASFGKPVGSEVFETCVWIGRFIGAFGGSFDLITRPQIKQHLCHSFFKVTDGAIRQRLLDLFGGKELAVGKKKTPGPLYGIKGDEWQALAVGVVWWSRRSGMEAIA